MENLETSLGMKFRTGWGLQIWAHLEYPPPPLSLDSDGLSGVWRPTLFTGRLRSSLKDDQFLNNILKLTYFETD